MSIKQTIQEAVATGNPVIVDFWRDGCAPCKGLEMQLAVIQNKQPHVTIIKVKAGESVEADELFAESNVRNAPTIFMYNKGQQVKVHVGNLPASKILDILDIED